MKNYLIFTSLLLCTQFTTFTMEHHGYQKIDSQQFNDYWDTEEETQTISASSSPMQTVSLDEFNKAITAIDEAINKKYVASIWRYKYQLDSLTLEKKDFFDIIEIIHQHSTDYDMRITIKLIQKLFAKNCYCLRAFNHFIDLAHEEIKNVIDIDDIGETIRFLCRTQSVQFDTLPRQIQFYFMTYAYKHKIDHSYDIVLKGHQDCITYFDIHPGTHRAATSSLDKTLRLWDLTTGKCISIFPGDDNTAQYMKFSSGGAFLATATNCTDNSSTIKIWDTESAKILHNKQVNAPVCYALDYHNHNNTFAMRPLHRHERFSDSTFRKYPYTTRNPAYNPNEESTLAITKLDCRDLYIYEQVIKNNPLKMHADKIDQANFTDYEKDRLHKLLIVEQTTRKLACK